MENLIYIVFDVDGNVYGVYEEEVDADGRLEELEADSRYTTDFLIEEYPLNRDVDLLDE